jgi:hypothetical protein
VNEQEEANHPWRSLNPLRGGRGITFSGPIIYPSSLAPGTVEAIVADLGPHGESAGSGAGDFAGPKFRSAPRAARAARRAAAMRRRRHR